MEIECDNENPDSQVEVVEEILSESNHSDLEPVEVVKQCNLQKLQAVAETSPQAAFS